MPFISALQTTPVTATSPVEPSKTTVVQSSAGSSDIEELRQIILSLQILQFTNYDPGVRAFCQQTIDVLMPVSGFSDTSCAILLGIAVFFIALALGLTVVVILSFLADGVTFEDFLALLSATSMAGSLAIMLINLYIANCGGYILNGDLGSSESVSLCPCMQ